MLIKKLSPLLAAVILAPAIPACNSGQGLLRAKQIEVRNEVVGGPVAVADVGDFLLENDQIRIGILGVKDSPGPGVFGGSVVDIDRRRAREEFSNAEGRDRFSEMFPVANLLVPSPEPDKSDVRVLKDGSDGKEAIIRVEGNGEFLYEALSLLRDSADLLNLFFPFVKTTIRFQTDYILRPGDRHLTMRTTLLLQDKKPPGCPSISDCELGPEDCEFGLQADENTCPICACSDALPLELYDAPVSVFGTILGDPTGQDTPAVIRTGVIAGDFVFFGNQNDVFAPGPGFDEDDAVQGAYLNGRNQFQTPLIYDFAAAAGGDISYGYFTHDPEGGNPVVNVPLFASAATAFLAAGKNCLFDTADDDSCDKHRAFTYERYLAVGDGDVSSVLSEVYRVRGTKTGTLRGHVITETTGEGSPNAQVSVFWDPDPAKEWTDIDQVIEANIAARGDVGMYTSIDADLGLDLLEDGDFQAALLPGNYVIVARDQSGTVLSAPSKIIITDGGVVELSLRLPELGIINYRVVDESGLLSPAKVALVSVDELGTPLEGDGKRRPYLGDGRLGNGKRRISLTTSGEGHIDAEPGRYILRVSRGPEYSLYEDRGPEGKGFVIGSGEIRNVLAPIAREVDTVGWMSADLHLHATPSFDSGMALPRRVATVASEGVEFALATDHDAETDYGPTIESLALKDHVKSAVSAETTTLEQGHFIGFPMAYDHLTVPTHGAHDWTCQSGTEIFQGVRAQTPPDKDMFLLVAHPRDGFFGYVDQLGVDGFTMNRQLSTLTENNPVFRTADCNFDGMEIIAGKRFDLIRTPSVREVVDWNRCLARVNASQTPEELAVSCPEVSEGPFAVCNPTDRFQICKGRARTALATLMTKRILARTADEQDRNWDFGGTMEDSQQYCSPAVIADDDAVPAGLGDEPCSYRPGQVDDFFRYLERGLLATQISSSDGHNDLKEPGYPRTYFLSSTDAPLGLSEDEVVQSLKAGQAFSTYGPFVWSQIDGKTYGQTVKSQAGQNLEMLLDVRTASWFGVDRVEVYMNGRLVRLYQPNVPVTETHDLKGIVPLTVPDRDSWVVVIAMGLKDENLMAPVSVDVPFGEVQLSRLAADAFGQLPILKDFFVPPPTLPDWSPIFGYAITNPIYIDVDGNGKYDAPLPYPGWCSKPCDPSKPDNEQCADGQVCLERELVCGINVAGKCDHRRAVSETE
ncbi:MAG: PHP domain-containing protein [Polyangiaceae bacterium]|nr:PHP domain-containing protein [Polyangiaceae bacterium]